MKRVMRLPAGRTILLLALVVLAGCGGKQSDEPAAKPEAAPQQSPAPGPAPETRPAPPAPAPREESKPEASPQRPKQEPSPSPAAEPPALVPGKPVPEAAKPTPGQEGKPPEPKPAPQPPSAPQKPAAGESKTAAVRDVIVLTGSPMGGVRLEHKLHAQRAGNSCATCHHTSKKEKPASAPQQACSNCHTKTAAPPMKTKYQAAFHSPTALQGTCIDCHKSENAKGKKAPFKCVECHKKENK